MKFSETRRLDATALRTLCIEHDWYTRGTNEQYAKLFDRLYDEDGCNINLTADKLFEIAEDIYQHSVIEDYTVDTIMYVLAKASTYYFECREVDAE